MPILTDAQIAAKNSLADSKNPLGSSPSPVYTANQTQVSPVYSGTAAQTKNIDGSTSWNSPSVSTTTVSNTNKIDQVPGIVSKLNDVANKGITTDINGTPRYADGSIYQEADTKSEDDSYNGLLESMKSNLDASTKASIDNIQQKFEQRKQEQEDVNRRGQANINNALLMGGVTGQGSSAQYAPVSSQGIMSSAESYGIKQLASLDSEEQDLIAQARKSQSEGNYQILEKQLTQIADKRKEKLDYAKQLNDQILEENKKQREQNLQAEKDSTIAEAYGLGVTDVPGIIAAAKAKGVILTSKEVADSLKNIVPPGLDDLMKTLRINHAPTDVINKVLASKDINEAYNNAGEYGAGGTGIIGEYNFYKAQAQAAGQVPMDFNQYQNADANRKVLANSGTTVDENGNVIQTGDYDALTIGRYNKAVNAATSILQKNPTFKNIIGSSAYLDRIEAAVQNPGSVGDQELLDAFTQLNTGGNRVTEAQVNLITGNQSLSDLMNKAGNKLKKGGALSDAQRTEIVQLAHEVYKKYQASYKPLYEDAVKKLKDQGIPEEFWNLPSPETLSRAVNSTLGGSTGDSIIEDESKAESTLKAYKDANPGKVSEIDTHIKAMEKTLGRPANASEFLQAFPEYKGNFSSVGGDTNIASVSIPSSSRLSSVNNNPGNLRYAGQSGAVKGEGGFAKFTSPEEGAKALVAQIALDAKRGHTLKTFISKYAPSSENDTSGYISTISKQLNVSPTALISSIDIKKLAQAIAQFESGAKIV